MQFTPRSEQELQEAQAERAEKFGPWPSGVYDAEILNGCDKVSKKGSDMIELEVNVFNADGATRKLKDWLLPAVEHKLRHACVSAGLVQEYESGMLHGYMFNSQTCKVRLAIEPGQGDFGPRNVIKDYVVERASPGPFPDRHSNAKVPSRDIDDEIPF